MGARQAKLQLSAEDIKFLQEKTGQDQKTIQVAGRVRTSLFRRDAIQSFRQSFNTKMKNNSFIVF